MQNNIKALRKARGKTQQELADECHTSIRMIQYLEDGERSLNTDWLTKISKALDVSIFDILGGAEGGWTSQKIEGPIWEIVETVIEIAREHPKLAPKHCIAIAKALLQMDTSGKPASTRNLRNEAEILAVYEMARN